MHPLKFFCKFRRTGHGSDGSIDMKRDRFRRTRASVTNGAGCRIWRGLSVRAETPAAALVLRSESRNLCNLLSGCADRSLPSTGDGRGVALEYPGDPVAEDRRARIRQVISLPESHRRAGGFEKLAVVAERDMLGHLRRLMPKSLQEKRISEVPKSLPHRPEQELVEVVEREMQGGTDLS